jgi:acetoin utilization deacetylase AcuC-like enzyme
MTIAHQPMRTFFDTRQNQHQPASYFSRGQMRAPQEVAQRTAAICAGLRELNWTIEQPQDSGLAAIDAVHDAGYLAFLQSAFEQWKQMPSDWGDEVMSNVYVREPNPLRGILGQAARYLADGSCPVGQHTWSAAYWGAQCAIAATSAVLDGAPAAYALCRPPGHHARADAAGGFCYLNNAAIAAQQLRTRYARVAVLDTDVHHGQGVQEIFYERRDVLYVSVHADPTNFYPVVAGFEDETGVGAGQGFNLNLPMPHGSDESVFFDKLDQAIAAIAAFQPEALVLSHGYDIYQDDPQTKVAVTTPGFTRLGAMVAGLGLPTVIVQEGGYHLESLAANTVSFFTGFMSQSGGTR